MARDLPNLPQAYLGRLLDELDFVMAREDGPGKGAGWLAAMRRLRESLGGDPSPAELIRHGVLQRVHGLHRLAILGEARGWLEPAEAIVLRRLAYRLSFHLRRELGGRPPPAEADLLTRLAPTGPNRMRRHSTG